MEINTLDEKRIAKMAHWLLRDFNKAVYQYAMIQDGDRIAVGVSGGKDSLSLLKLLHIRTRTAPEKYQIIAIHISADTNGPAVPYPPLVEWLEASEIEFHLAPLEITGQDTLPLNCHRCTWNRKRQIFKIAEELDCNVVALGHHADDLAQTTLMNLLFHGRTETIQPVSQYFGSKFRLIRPMCLIPEKKLASFARANQFPINDQRCPQEADSQRMLAKDFLNQVNREFPNVRRNLINAGLNNNNQPDQN